MWARLSIAAASVQTAQSPMRNVLTLVCLIGVGCTVNTRDYRGLACDEQHPCRDGRVCRDGTCVDPALLPPDDGGAGGGAGGGEGGGAGGGGGVGGGQGGGAGGGDGGSTCDAGCVVCAVGVGACVRTGCVACDGSCSATAGQPQNESCNGVDDNCNGVTDDVSGCMYTFAGRGPPSFEDGVGASASFAKPHNLTARGTDVYVADSMNHAIRKIDINGNVTTFAGTGICGFSDGPVASAMLCEPHDLEFDSTGALFFVDSGNNRLRKIVNGTVSTVAGSGVLGFQNGAASTARFAYPMGLSVRPNGDVLIADAFNSRIRRFVAATNQVVSVAGSGAYGYSDGDAGTMQLGYPVDVVQHSSGDLFISDAYGPNIRRVDASNGLSSHFVGTNYAVSSNAFGYLEGSGTAARIAEPGQLLLDEATQELFFLDAWSYRVRAAPLDGGTTRPIVGGTYGFRNGPSPQAGFYFATGFTRMGATWFIADWNDSVRRIVDTGSFNANVVEPYAGLTPETAIIDGPANGARLRFPGGLVMLAGGTLLWTEPENNAIRTYSADAGVKTLIGDPQAWSDGYVNGTFAQARVWYPTTLRLGPDGRLYFADQYNGAIRVLDLDAGIVSTFAGPQTAQAGYADGTLAAALFWDPAAIAFGMDAQGNSVMYVAEVRNFVIRKIVMPNGPVSTIAGTVGVSGVTDGPPGTGRFGYPRAITADNAGNVWVVDDRYIRKVTPNGVITTLYYKPPFQNDGRATALKYDAAAGRLIGVGNRQIVALGLDGGVAPTILYNARSGWRDGVDAGVWAFEDVLVTPNAFILSDAEPGGRLRQLWR